MKTRSVLSVTIASTTLAWAAPLPATSRDTASALAVADRYLSAWQMRRAKEGLPLLSPELRRKRTDEKLRWEIIGLSNPHHQAYEVYEVRRLSRSRVAVAVRLFEEYTGYEKTGPRPPKMRMILVRLPSGEWKVDELPVQVERSKRVVSADYDGALAAADRYLDGWQHAKETDGRGHVAYEVSDGQAFGKNGFAFAVRLYEMDARKRLRTRWGRITLAKDRSGLWKVSGGLSPH